MKPYPAYKSSGVPWLGEIPEQWDVVQFKHFVEIQNGSDHKHVEQAEGYPVFGSGGVFAYASDFLYDGESVLLGRKGTIDKPLHVTGRFWTVDTMYWTKISPDASGRFAYYLALTIPFDYYSTNTAVPSMTKGNLSGHLVSRPPIREQQAIAAYLDRETARIDELMREKEGLIGLLRESVETVITESVTGGLNAAAQRQPEQHQGLDKVPADWCVVGMTKKIESIVDYRGKTPTKTDDGVFLVTARNIGDGRIDYEASKEYVSADEYEDIMRRGLPRKGDVLFTTEAPLGHVAQVDREDVALAQRVIKFRGLEGVLSNAFLKYWLMSRFMQETLKSWSSGSTAEGIKSGRLVRLPLALPPIEEQHEIVEYIEIEIAHIDDLIAHTTDEIKLLQELRAATITDAVTGKIQVS